MCNHENKTRDEIYIVCKDCGTVLEDDSIRDNYFYPKPQPETKKIQRSKNELYFRDELKNEKVENLRKIAKAMGIKYTAKLHKDQLIEKIHGKSKTPVDKIKIIFTSVETSEEHRFPSIYRASKTMGVSTSQISYHIGDTKVVKGIKYKITKVN